MINSSLRSHPLGREATVEDDVSMGVIVVEARGTMLITVIGGACTKAEVKGVRTGSDACTSTGTGTSDAGSVIKAEADEVLDCRIF